MKFYTKEGEILKKILIFLYLSFFVILIFGCNDNSSSHLTNKINNDVKNNIIYKHEVLEEKNELEINKDLTSDNNDMNNKTNSEHEILEKENELKTNKNNLLSMIKK